MGYNNMSMEHFATPPPDSEHETYFKLTQFVAIVILTPIFCLSGFILISVVVHRHIRVLRPSTLMTSLCYVAAVDVTYLTSLLVHDVTMTSYKLELWGEKGSYWIYAYFYLGTSPIQHVLMMVTIWFLVITLLER